MSNQIEAGWRLPDALRELKVRHIMTSRVRTVGRRQSAKVAAEIMRNMHIQHLIVVDAAGRVCGVLSDRDIRSAAPSSANTNEPANLLPELRVDELMAANPVVVQPSEDLAFALRKMRARKIGCLAVVDELGTAVGIITGYDVVTLALELLERVRTA